MTSRAIPAITLCLMLGLPASLVLAHTTVASTSPQSGSVLDQSPPLIEIKFRDAASLTSVVVLEAGKPDRRLQFTPIGSATSFKIQDPGLGSGRNEIQWKALSMDGHVISGSLILMIKTRAAKTN